MKTVISNFKCEYQFAADFLSEYEDYKLHMAENAIHKIEEITTATERCFKLKDEYSDSLKTAINALEKEIPKEPIWEGDGYSDGEMVYDTWFCPNCDASYEDTEKHNYCPHCGQKISWNNM